MGDDDKIALSQVYDLVSAIHADETVSPMGEMKTGDVFVCRHLDAPRLGEVGAEVQRTAHGQVGQDVTEKVKHERNIRRLFRLYIALNDLHDLWNDQPYLSVENEEYWNSVKSNRSSFA